MNTQDFETYIKNIRKEALEIGYSITTMDGYLKIWNKFTEWKNEVHFIYDKKEYSEFLCFKGVSKLFIHRKYSV